MAASIFLSASDTAEGHAIAKPRFKRVTRDRMNGSPGTQSTSRDSKRPSLSRISILGRDTVKLPSSSKANLSFFLPASCCQPLIQLRPASPPRDVAYGDRDGLLLADQHDQSLASRHASVEQVALQHDVVLRQHRDHDGGIFRSLALMDRRRISRHQRVEFAKPVGDRAAIEAGG